MKNELDEILKDEWQKVRKAFYFPQLASPILTDEVENGQFSFEDQTIKISPKYITWLYEHGIKREDAFNETVSHEVNHFVRFPGSFLTILRLHKDARKVVDASKADALVYLFNEIQNNMSMALDLKHPQTMPIQKLLYNYYLEKDHSKIKTLENALYQSAWNIDLGIKLDAKDSKILDALLELDYTDKTIERLNIKRFCNILKDYSVDNQKGHLSISMFNGNQIMDGIKQFAQEFVDSEYFEQMVKEVLDGSIPTKDYSQKNLHTTGAGTKKGEFTIANDLYSALAASISIPIKKLPKEKSGALYPYSHGEFSLENSMDELDPFSSPGIMPGITKKWIKREGETYRGYMRVPDSVICIDNSGSMPDPSHTISIAVLGATAISNAYLDNGSNVTVYNFGGGDSVFGPSTNKERIHSIIRGYTGSGTVFNPEYIMNMLNTREKEFDVSIVSDMEISNIDTFVKTLQNISNIHRVHLLYTNPEDIDVVRGIERQLSSYKNVAFLQMYTKNDIYNITMGELKKSVV